MKEKSVNIIIEETKENLVKAINESKLPVSILELIMKDLYAEVRSLASEITTKEMNEYKKQTDANISV